MYALENKEIIKVDESKRLIVLTYSVQDGAGSTEQKVFLMARVPAESDDSG